MTPFALLRNHDDVAEWRAKVNAELARQRVGMFLGVAGEPTGYLRNDGRKTPQRKPYLGSVSTTGDGEDAA